MLNFNSVLLSTDNLEELSKFYTKVFEKNPEMDYEGYKGFLVGSCFLSIGFHDKIKGKAKDPSRILFNFETKEVKKEFERIEKLGAKVVAKPYQMEDAWIATLEDPDGNYFQLLTPWEG